MIDFVKQWVINIVTLVLFIVMFEMLLPTGKMKKVVGLVTGTILIISIITPLVGLLDKNIDFTALQTSNGDALDKMQVEKDSKLLEEEQMEQIVEVYRQKIIEQLEQNAKEVEGVEQVRADIIFNEDYNSKTFGEIKRAYLQITTNDGDTKEDGSSVQVSNNGGGDPTGEEERTIKAETVTKIEHVKVGEVKKEQDYDKNVNPVLKRKLEERIGQVFGVKSENIIISQIKR